MLMYWYFIEPKLHLYYYIMMSTCVGDVHISVMDRGGQIEVEITQARGLTPKPGSKNIPGKNMMS